MSDFESIEGSGLSEEAEQALENEAEENLERLLYRDERRFLKESQKKKKLKREIERESLARLERLAKTEEDFGEVIRQWDRLEENADRRFRYHETVRGDVPLEYGIAEQPHVIPTFLNSRYWKAVRAGNYTELIFDCPYEIDQITSYRYISKILRELKDEHKELLHYLVIRGYGVTQFAELLGQTDRNIRKKRLRLIRRIQRRLYKFLSQRREKGGKLTNQEIRFLDSYEDQDSDDLSDE